MQIPEFTIGQLARLEQIPCPRCEFVDRLRETIGETAFDYPCDLCSDERRLWRVRKEAS